WSSDVCSSDLIPEAAGNSPTGLHDAVIALKETLQGGGRLACPWVLVHLEVAEGRQTCWARPAVPKREGPVVEAVVVYDSEPSRRRDPPTSLRPDSRV